MTLDKKYKIYIDSTKRDIKVISLIDYSTGKDIVIDIIEGAFDINTSIGIILDRNNLDLRRDILEFVPNTGPGSFTGIKIGIAIANTLNWVIGNNKTYEPNYGGEPNITISNK